MNAGTYKAAAGNVVGFLLASAGGLLFFIIAGGYLSELLGVEAWLSLGVGLGMSLVFALAWWVVFDLPSRVRELTSEASHAEAWAWFALVVLATSLPTIFGVSDLAAAYIPASILADFSGGGFLLALGAGLALLFFTEVVPGLPPVEVVLGLEEPDEWRVELDAPELEGGGA